MKRDLALTAFLLSSDRTGGAETATFRLVEAMNAQGVAAEVWLVDRDEEFGLAASSPVPVRTLGARRARKATRPLLGLTRARKPHTLVSVNSTVLLPTVVVSRLVGCAHVNVVHNSWSTRLAQEPKTKRLVHTGLMRLLYRFPDAIVGISEEVTHELTPVIDDQSARRQRTIPNLVLRDGGVRAPRERGQELAVTFVGSLKPVKAPGLFLQLVAELRSRGRLVRAQVAGDGPLRSSLEDESTGEDLNIEFHGQVADPSGIYQSTDILVVTSESEGLPNVAVEALASGCLVVTTPCSAGLERLVLRTGGRVAASMSPADLADAVESIDLDRPRQVDLQEFSAPSVVAAWVELLANL